jgi:hypothetical protein
MGKELNRDALDAELEDIWRLKRNTQLQITKLLHDSGMGMLPLVEAIQKELAAGTNPVKSRDLRQSIKMVQDFCYPREQKTEISGSIQTTGFSPEEIEALKKDK